MVDVDTSLHVNEGIVDKRRGRGTTGANLGTPANYQTVAALKARLAAVAAGVYGGAAGTARMNTMTRNDLVWALRQSDDAAGI